MPGLSISLTHTPHLLCLKVCFPSQSIYDYRQKAVAPKMQVFGFGDGRNILFAVDYYYSFLYQGMGGSCPPSLAKNLLIPHLVKFSFLAVVIT